MADFWRSTAESDNEEEEEDEGEFSGRDGFIFLVDCAPAMFESSLPDSRSKFRTALESIEAAMRNRIIVSDRDLIGVLFYNTLNSPDSGSCCSDMNLVLPKKSAIFIPYDTQKVENIEQIIDFQKDDFEDFENKFGHSTDCNLSDVFWFCSKAFIRLGYKMRDMTIVLFTDNPQPHPKGSHELKRLVIKANDLQQNGVRVTLIPMDPAFDCDLFYKQFLCLVQDIDFDSFEAPSFDVDITRLTSRIYRADYRKKANSRVEFLIDDDVKLGVAIYSMSRKANKPGKIIMDRNTNDLIIKKRVYQQEDENGEVTIMGPGDQRKSIEFGGEKVFFTVEEHSRIYTVIPKGIKLLGFKPKRIVQSDVFVKESLFLYPDEENYPGSTKLFRALWEGCLDTETVIIAVMVQRFKSTPVYVALVPQKQEETRNNGFRIVFLLYKNDQKELDVFTETAPSIEEEEKNLFKQLVKKIKFKYNPKFFDNPDLKKFYSNIESIVYKAQEAEFEDHTIPKLNERIRDCCESIIEHFGQVSLDEKKRRPPANSQASQRAPKIPKLSPTGNLETDILNAITSGNEAQLKVAELKEYLKANGVSGVNARKDDLIKKVKQLKGL